MNIECITSNNNYHLKGEILINNLSYSYNGINKTISCQNIKINSSNKVLISGLSGSGKSTLMKLIVKYLDNYQGKILIDNKELSHYDIYNIRNNITYVSQDEIIYTDTIYNNIVLNNKISYKEYLKIIKITGVFKIVNKFVQKDEMILENNGNILSGGEKQRIILARALIKKSNIYIFDESFSGLDKKSEKIILNKIFKYLRNKTIIVISHRINYKNLFNKFVTIEEGIIKEKKKGEI